jgi:hypothetical protein
VSVPSGHTSYSTGVDATATLRVFVDIDARLNQATGSFTVTFTSLDPTTLDTPSNPLVGFLPPDASPPIGEGYINYTIAPKAGLSTGTPLNGQASIVFDTNAPLPTPKITNTIDASPPTSSVVALPASTTSTSFNVMWSGSDGAGPGIADYNVYVSDNRAAYNLWQSNTTATSATYTGQSGHTYRFYSVATDPLGLVQPTPATAQATTEVAPPPPPCPPSPPPVVTVTRVVEKRNKKHQVTEVDLIVSGQVNSAEARSIPRFRLATRGKKGFYTAENARVIKLKSAVYQASSRTVALTPKKPFVLIKPVQVLITGTPPSGLQDSLGRYIDGGRNPTAILAKRGVTITSAIELAADARPASEPAAVDAVLDRNHHLFQKTCSTLPR